MEFLPHERSSSHLATVAICVPWFAEWFFPYFICGCSSLDSITWYTNKFGTNYLTYYLKISSIAMISAALLSILTMFSGNCALFWFVYAHGRNNVTCTMNFKFTSGLIVLISKTFINAHWLVQFTIDKMLSYLLALFIIFRLNHFNLIVSPVRSYAI